MKCSFVVVKSRKKKYSVKETSRFTTDMAENSRWREEMKAVKRNYIIPLFFFVYAFVVMLLCAGSSPVIQYLSPDSSIFYTMGRSAANGTVLYKEIADHKGFYLFLFNWIGALLTPDSMNGLFFVEIVFAWVKLWFVYKTAKLFMEEEKRCVLAAMLFLAAATNFFSWNAGNLGEQFALAFWQIGLYLMAIYMEGNRKAERVLEHRPLFMFLHGVCACAVLFIQANLIAVWIPFGIGLAIILLKEKYISNFLKNLAALLGGAAAAALPVAVYGILNQCIEDMYYVMFEINFMYSEDGRIGKTVMGYFKEFFMQPSAILVLMAVAGTVVACRYYKSRYFTLTFTGMFLFSVLCMSVSLNANPIYYTTYIPFSVPLFIWLVKKVRISEKIWIAAGIGILVLTVICNLQLIKKVLKLGSSGYAYESARQMGELIEDKNAEVLVLGNPLYYNCTGTLPHIKYFTIFGSGLRYETFPYCIDEQYESLLSGENEYIMIQFTDENYNFWGTEEKDAAMNDYLEEQYECILEYSEGGIHSALYRAEGSNIDIECWN